MSCDASTTPLERRIDGLFTPSDEKSPGGADIRDGNLPPTIISGTLEGSSVSSFEAMARLLDLTRSFELRMKTIKEANTIDEAGASMLKSA